MKIDHTHAWQLKEINCPVCHVKDYKVLGVRGNREYVGADSKAEPHIVTNVVECRNCHFIFTNPMIFGLEHLERTHYNDPAAYQQDDRGTIIAMFEERLELLSTFAGEKALLDVGAGKGEFLFAAKRRGWNTTGIEPSPEFCRYAKEVFEVDIKQGFLDANSFQGQGYDVVTLNHVLEHIDEPYQLLALASQFLKKDGVLFIEVPNSGSILMRVADLFFRMKGLKWSSRLSPLHPPYHKYGYSERSLKYLLQKAGFSVLRVKTFPEADRRSQKDIRLLYRIRNIISAAINLFGQGELIAVVARPKSV